MIRPLAASGSSLIPAPPEKVWESLMDPEILTSLVPGADRVELLAPGRYRCSLMIGFLRTRYIVDIQLKELKKPGSLVMEGTCNGPFGKGSSTGRVVLIDDGCGGTEVRWSYDGTVDGALAVIGGPLIRLSAKVFVASFFAKVGRKFERPVRRAL